MMFEASLRRTGIVLQNLIDREGMTEETNNVLLRRLPHYQLASFNIKPLVLVVLGKLT
jgi:hypothetical protein